MAVITTTTTTSTRKRAKFPQERYYLIIKAILSGYGKSYFYHEKMTKDPRPSQNLIISLSGLGAELVRTDLKHMIRNGLIRCNVDERKKIFSSSKKRKPITTYEATQKGLRYVEDYDGNKISYYEK